jgi:hypothetical protein
MSSTVTGPLATYPGLDSPAPAPAPAPVTPGGLPAWAIALIVILIIFLLGVVGFMMTRTYPVNLK